MADTDEADPRVLAQRLTEARKACGKTQEETAEFLGCSRPTLIAMEKGVRPPKAEEIVKLASFFGRSVHELVRPGAPIVALEPHLRAAIDSSRGDASEVREAARVLARFAEDYRELERLLSAPLELSIPPEVHIPSARHLDEFAEDVACRERARLQLGDQPILNLRRTLDSIVGVRVFCDEMPSGIAGMYAYVPELGYCTLINRKHPKERQRASLAHEYGHFLGDRHKPGIDYLADDWRKPPNERFAEKFAMAFLAPAGGIRRQFHDILKSTNDFQVADLCRLSNFYFVSVQAMALRLEGLGLIARGTWDYLKEDGFKPAAIRADLGLASPSSESDERYPERYKYLAVQAFQRELISEGQLARFLRCNRIAARHIVEGCLTRSEVDAAGNEGELTMPLGKSLLPK